MTFVNAYLLAGGDADVPHNYIGVIYKMDVSVSLPQIGTTERYEYYYALVFNDLSFINGEWQLDLTAYKQPDSQVEYYPGGSYYFYYGYYSLEELMRISVDPLLDENYVLTTMY